MWRLAEGVDVGRIQAQLVQIARVAEEPEIDLAFLAVVQQESEVGNVLERLLLGLLVARPGRRGTRRCSRPTPRCRCRRIPRSFRAGTAPRPSTSRAPRRPTCRPDNVVARPVCDSQEMRFACAYADPIIRIVVTSAHARYLNMNDPSARDRATALPAECSGQSLRKRRCAVTIHGDSSQRGHRGLVVLRADAARAGQLRWARSKSDAQVITHRSIVALVRIAIAVVVLPPAWRRLGGRPPEAGARPVCNQARRADCRRGGSRTASGARSESSVSSRLLLRVHRSGALSTAQVPPMRSAISCG